MKPEDAQRDRQALEIFGRAIEVAGAEARAACLDDACGEDAVLRARVEALLANHVEDSFLQNPAAGIGPSGPVIVAITEKAGDRIGRYKLLQQIGEGGCGVVYMAEQDEPVRRRVALKVIKLGMDTKQVVARFEAERQALAMMDHPNIARVFDAGATDTGRPYFVMELVRGIKITEFCDQQKLSTRARLDLFMQVCSAVQHAHQKGIIHRDLKPSNILVTTIDGTPVPKVIDFGIAKATNQQRLTDKTLFTAFEQFIGTPAYMSPEQAEMSGVDIDTRSDIYSLGVVLYELLTGRTPFDAEQLFRSGLEGIRKTLREQEPSKPSTVLGSLAHADLTTVARARQTEPPRLLHQVSGDLDWVVMKCLEKDRARRYETANGLAQDVLRHLQNEPVTARPPSAAYRFQKAWRRNKVAFSAAAAVAAAVVVGLAFSTWAFLKEREARTRALSAEAQQSRERAKAEQASQTAALERDRAATLLSVSQARHGVELLEKSDPTGLLYLLEARKSVEHLPEERIRRTLLWSGWKDSLPKSQVGGHQAMHLANRAGSRRDRPWQATGGTNGEVTLTDAQTGAQVVTFKTGDRRVWVREMSADGRLLIVNVGGIFQLWDLKPVLDNQSPVRLVGKVFRYAFDAPRQRVVTYANAGRSLPGEANTDLPPPLAQVQVWDAGAEPALVTTWEGDRSDLSNHHFALSADGAKVVTGWETLTLWDAGTGRRIERPLRASGKGAQRRLTDLLFLSPDGRSLWEVVGRTCQRYDLTSGQPAGDAITGLHRSIRPGVSPNGQYLLLSLEQGFQVVQLDSGRIMGPLIKRDEDAMRALALSEDGAKLSTSGPDRAIRVWDTRTGRQIGQTLVPPTPAASAAFSADGNWLSIADHDGRVRMHSLTPQSPAWVKDWPGVKVIGFSAEDKLLTYTPGKQMMEWRDPATGQAISAGWSVPDRGPVIGSALSADGGTVAVAFHTGKMQSLVCLWDTATGTRLEPTITWTNVGALAFSPDGRTLAGLGGGDGSGSIQLWDVTSRRPQAHLPQSPKEVVWHGLRFSPDGRFIAARNSYVTYVWDVAAQRLASGAKLDLYRAISDDWTRALTEDLLDFTDPRQPRPAPHPITSRGTPTKRAGLALNVDGRLRVSEAGDKSVRLWDNTTGRPVGQEMKLGERIRLCVFSPDSRLLVVFEWGLLSGRGSSEKKSLRLWDTATGLPCGPAVPLTHMPTDFLFDRAVRLLAVPAPFETTGATIVHLPDRELSLAEMERQSLLLAGSRLDESGNIEVLSAEEMRRLEAAIPREETSTPPKEPPNAVRPAVEPSGPKAPTATLPAEIQAFIAAKEEQSRALATKLNAKLPAEIADFFRAARAGDWQQASNRYASLNRRLEDSRGSEESGALFVIRQTLLETHLALEYFTQAQPKYSLLFGRDIIASIPAGSIYFGGTDPGRGLVTALSKSHVEADPFFTLTQNALADSSYLGYLRETYGQRILLPTSADSQASFQTYLADAQRRMEHDREFPAEPKQIRPGEDIKMVDNRVQVSGQVAVMSINALLGRMIFEKNPRLEFYVEESFPLDWMYPHLQPHALIMKLNREPFERLSSKTVKADQEFWSSYLKPLVGDWLKEETGVSEVCDFAERVFVHKDLKGFAGDPAYVSDAYACKAFSRLRTSIAGVFRWRAVNAKDEAERERMTRAADLAFRQALALCPYSREAVSRYVRALAEDGQMDDARRVAELAAKFPETRSQGARLIRELESDN